MDMQNIDFKIVNISTTEFSIIDDLYIEESEGETSLGVSFKFGLDEENQSLIIFNKFQFFQSSDTPFLSIETSCEFSIKDPKLESFKKDDIVTIPVEFIQRLAMISIGTTRGLLHAKVEDTKYKTFILPIVYVDEILKENLVFDK